MAHRPNSCDIMEPLLLFSLFITHLAVGGELLQYSTGVDSVVHVSDDGIDDSTVPARGNVKMKRVRTHLVANSNAFAFTTPK